MAEFSPDQAHDYCNADTHTWPAHRSHSTSVGDAQDQTSEKGDILNSSASPRETQLPYQSEWTSRWLSHSLTSDHNAHLKPLSFPEKRVEISSCFVSEQSDHPIFCFVCSTKFILHELNLSQQPNIYSAQTSSENSPSLKISKELVTESDSILPQENFTTKRDSNTKGGFAADIAPKPPKMKLTPRDEWMRHLLLEHKIVIHNVDEICSLKCYSEYWRRRLGESPINEVAPVIRTNTDSHFASEDYYLFSSDLPEEKSLRHYLHKKKLEAVLEVQQGERDDNTFSRRCLFCSQVFSGNRRELFQHMLDSHGFNVGQPDNLVFVREFLDALQEKLDRLQCLYCERTFRDRTTLKDHMRKKGHKKISPQNKIYDRFYMINYLELGRTWEQVQEEESGALGDSEWLEDPSPLSETVYCLFCLSPLTCPETALQHMRDTHGFDLCNLSREEKLDYYGQVKLVNYIRRRIHSMSCVCCGQQFSSQLALLDHMTSSSHFKLPCNRTIWDQPQYLFPTYENDSLLYGLDDELN